MKRVEALELREQIKEIYKEELNILISKLSVYGSNKVVVKIYENQLHQIKNASLVKGISFDQVGTKSNLNTKSPQEKRVMSILEIESKIEMYQKDIDFVERFLSRLKEEDEKRLIEKRFIQKKTLMKIADEEFMNHSTVEYKINKILKDYLFLEK